MKFLANENFPYPSSNILRAEDYEVILIAKNYAGISDFEVIEIAKKINAIILTFDKDYGEIIFKYRISNPPAVIFFRDKGNDPFFAGRTLIMLLQNEKLILEGRYTVIEKNGVRQRSFS